ncbi:unnamed protein product [Closterium sp. NIES-65]|nr:unnamed protein product [Closterium sp. NIES-65]
MSPSCAINDTSATAHHHHLPPRHHSPLHASVSGTGDFSLSSLNVPQIALPAAALCSPTLRPTTTEPRHLSTKEPPRQPLPTVPAAAHRSDGATSGGGGVWRSKSHGGCFRNQHVAPCDDDDENDGDDDDKQKEEGEDGGDDDWLVTYSRTSTSYTRPAPVVATSKPVSVCATSLKPSYHAGNPLALGAAVAAAAAAATASASASASAAVTTTNAAGNQAAEEEDEDFNAWMLSAEDAARSGGGGRNVTASARGGGKGGGAAGVGQSQACGSRGATDSGPDGDESEWSATLMDPSRSDRRSSTGDRRRSSRLSASSRRRNAMEYSELDAIRERLLHATQLWAITLGLPVLSLDLSLHLRVRAQNPNYMPVSYSAATVAIYYDGTKIGESNMGAGQFMPRDNKVMELSATMSALELAAANAQRLLSDMVNRSVTVEAVTSFPAVAHGLCDSLHPRLLVMHADSVSAPSIPSPMEPALLSAISAIHAAPARAVLAVTGGASQAVGWLVAVPGASQTVLEAVLPYSQRAFDQYVDATWHAQAQVQLAAQARGEDGRAEGSAEGGWGAEGEEGKGVDGSRKQQTRQQYVSRAAAQQLAFASYNRALSLAPIAQPVVGVGCTCALVSSAPKRGAHRCHIAARSQGMLWEYSLLLSKEALRSRQQEDDMASRLLIRVLAASMGLPAVAGGVAVGEGRGDGVEEAAAVVGQGEQIQEVLDGRVAYAVFAAPTWASRWGAAGEGRRVVLCGSFNPLHQGHTDLMAAALLEVPGGVPCYEMAAWNADKGAIPVEEVERRVHQFTAHGHMVVVTRLPLFASKASLFPHSTFVIGYDTAVRLLDAKYYGNSHSSMMNVLHGIARSGCDFLVAGRLVGSTFQSSESLVVPESVAARQAAAATATAASDDAGASESSW